MSHHVIIAGFAGETDLLRAVTALRERNWPVLEAYTPYPVHGLAQALGLRRSRLSVVCFICGLVGVVLALSCQVWTTALSWPLNVGGQPWNSLPAFVPVTFEAMVLFAGLGLVFAWLLRCRLYPGKKAYLLLQGETDNRFVLVLGGPRPGEDIAEIQNLLRNSGAIHLEERDA
jgi:ActD protein